MRFYLFLLSLYPASFRVEYASELERLHRERRLEVSGVRVLWFWCHETLDVVTSAAGVQLDVLRQDLGYALRTLRRAPGFTATAILVSALGIGANAAVFSVTDRVLVRPLPFKDSERLTALWENMPGYTRMELSPPNYKDWKRLSGSFETMGAFTTLAKNLVGGGEPQRIEGALVTSEVLEMLGVTPVLGRLFDRGDDAEGASQVVLLSYALWQAQFAGAADIVGKAVRLDDQTFTVAGVLPAEFSFPSRDTRLWMPFPLTGTDNEDRTNNYLDVVARLKAGVTLKAARAELNVVAKGLSLAYPAEDGKLGATVLALKDQLSAEGRLLLGTLRVASACVLLLTCANLAGLLLARALQRRREIAVRAAMGAGRERLVRQLMTESVLLAFLGGGVGLGVAMLLTPLLYRLVPASLPLPGSGAVDARMIVFAALLSLATGVGFGVVPALRTGRVDAGALREGPRGGVGGSRQRLRSFLVVAEVAASVVLVVASGLLIRALWRVRSVDPGFKSEGVLKVQTALPMPRYSSTMGRDRLYAKVIEGVRAIPGVKEAAYISFTPMTMRGGIWPVEIGGETATRGDSRSASLRYVTPGFFRTLGIPLEMGRDVDWSDTQTSPFVAVVSRSFVTRHWPGLDPLGRRFTFGLAERTVVGVVGDVRVRGLERTSEPQVYLPHRQVPDDAIVGYAPKDLLVRGSLSAESLLPSIRRVIAGADPELPVSNVETLQDVVDSDSGSRAAQVRVLTAFALLALLLAGFGIYGVLAYLVSERLPEFGVRLALGARPVDILEVVMASGARLAALGATAGLVLAYLAGLAMESVLFGVRPSDLPTFAASFTLAVLMTLAGSLAPALRALRIDPTIALRADL